MRLRKLRKGKDLTMKEFGEMFGLSESAISQYETGKRNADYETLLKFAEFFECSLDYLLGRSDDFLSLDAKDTELVQEMIDLLNHPEVQTALKESVSPEVKRLYDEQKKLIDLDRKIKELKPVEAISAIGLSEDSESGPFTENEKKLISVSRDEREDLFIHLFENLSLAKRGEVLRYIQFLASTEEDEAL